MNPRISPFELEVVKSAFETIADELAIIIMRTSCSSIVRDAIDYSTALCDAGGRTLAQGATTPLHLGSFHDAMRNLVATQADTVAPGDIFIFNGLFQSRNYVCDNFIEDHINCDVVLMTKRKLTYTGCRLRKQFKDLRLCLDTIRNVNIGMRKF